MRFELTTPGLQDQCSATELRRPGRLINFHSVNQSTTAICGISCGGCYARTVRPSVTPESGSCSKSWLASSFHLFCVRFRPSLKLSC